MPPRPDPSAARTSGRVLVVGSINMDIVVTSTRHPRIGETVIGETITRLPGGKGSNQAVASAASGAITEFVGAVGDDAAGLRLRAFLEERGVSVNGLRSIPGTSSGVAVVVVAGGDNAVVVVSGANAQLGPDALAGVSIGPRDVLVSQFEIAEATIHAFFERGRAAGARTVLNPSPFRESSEALWALSDVIVVNQIELESLCAARGLRGSLDHLLDNLSSVTERTDQAIVVTLGAGGCLVANGGHAVRIAGRPARVVDTTGAGDCFVGFMAGELAHGKGLEAAAELANVASSLCVQRMGAGSSIPTADEVAAATRRSAT